jgi:hypothetical protein
MRALRRLRGFLLVPLSALPLVAVAPVVVSSAGERLGELHGEPAATRSVITPTQTTEGSLPPMCGIVGYPGQRPCLELLLGGLERLEYRGYDPDRPRNLAKAVTVE